MQVPNRQVFWMDCEDRGHIYHFLSACLLKPPSEEMIAAVLNQDLLQQIGSVIGDEAVGPLQILANEPASGEEIRRSYEALFRVPSGRYAGPFESVYRDLYSDDRGKVRRRLMGPCALHAAEMYRAAGCSVSRDGMLGGMPDFIGTELGFMQYLCEQERAASDASDCQQLATISAFQRQFLHEHLTCWLPNLADRVNEVDEVGFFAALLHLACVFVRGDAAEVAGGAGRCDTAVHA